MLNEITLEQRRAIYDRQNGMCAFTGKKFEEFNDSIEVEFVAINSEIAATDNDNIVMVWKKHKAVPKTNLCKYFFLHANFSNYDATQKSEEFKKDADEVLSSSNTSDDFKQVRNRIKELTIYLNGLGLTYSARNEFREQLKKALDNLLKRENEIREKNKEVWKTNYDMIKEKVDAAVEFAKTSSSFKISKEKLIEVQKELLKLSMNINDKNQLNATLSNEIKVINEKFQSWVENNEMLMIENYYTLRNIIDDAIQKAFSFESFPEARTVLNEAQNQIREKTLRRSQREELFKSIHTTFDELREKFDDYKRITEEEATENYAKLKIQVDAAIEYAKTISVEDSNDARNKFIQLQALVKETRLKREQKLEFFDAIRNVFDDINEMSKEERKKFDAEAEENYKNLLTKIEVVIVDIENGMDFRQSASDLATISDILRLEKLRKNERIKLYDVLRTAYNLLNNKRDEYNKYKFNERSKRLNETLDDMKIRNDRNVKLLQKDKEILAKQKEKFSTISEENTILKEKNRQITTEIENRIAEKEKFIAKTKKRIAEIEKEIEKNTKAEKNIEIRKEKRETQQLEKNSAETKTENSTTEQHTIAEQNSVIEQNTEPVAEQNAEPVANA